MSNLDIYSAVVFLIMTHIGFFAYEAAQKEIAELKKEIEELKSNPTSAFYKERKLLREQNEQLTAALKVAEDALLGIVITSSRDKASYEASEALAKIQKIKEGLG